MRSVHTEVCTFFRRIFLFEFLMDIECDHLASCRCVANVNIRTRISMKMSKTWRIVAISNTLIENPLRRRHHFMLATSSFRCSFRYDFRPYNQVAPGHIHIWCMNFRIDRRIEEKKKNTHTWLYRLHFWYSLLFSSQFSGHALVVCGSIRAHCRLPVSFVAVVRVVVT